MMDDDVIIRAFPDALLRVSEDGDGLTVEGLVIPYDRVIDAVDLTPDGPVRYREVFRAGSNQRAVKAPNRVAFTFTHEDGLPTLMGHGATFLEDRAGLRAVFRLYPSRADIARDVLTSSHKAFSAGFSSILPRTGTEREGMLVERRSVWLRHVAAVPEGQYAEAGVTAIREQPPDEDTPPDDGQAGELLAWVDTLGDTMNAWRSRVDGSTLTPSDTPAP